MFIEVNQADKRAYKSNKAFKSFEYGRVRMLVGRLKGDEICGYEVNATSA